MKVCYFYVCMLICLLSFESVGTDVLNVGGQFVKRIGGSALDRSVADFIRLEEYKGQATSRLFREDLVRKFLDDQIAGFGYDKEKFTYLIGDVWRVEPKMSGGLYFIMPDASSYRFSYLNFAKDLAGTAPVSELNINDLSAVLIFREVDNTRQQDKYDRYRLRVLKSLLMVPEDMQDVALSEISKAAVAGTAAALFAGSIRIWSRDVIEPAIWGISTLYSKYAGNAQEAEFGKKLDEILIRI